MHFLIYHTRILDKYLCQCYITPTIRSITTTSGGYDKQLAISTDYLRRSALAIKPTAIKPIATKTTFAAVSETPVFSLVYLAA